MKISFICHLSNQEPSLPSDLLNGIELGIPQEYQIVKKFLPINSAAAEIVEAVNLTYLEGAEIVILYSGTEYLISANEFAARLKKPIILIESGAQPNFKHQKLFEEVWISLHLNESFWCLGQHIANLSQQNVFLLSDFISSGYQFSAFFLDPILSAGGEVCAQVILNPSQDVKAEIPLIKQRILEEKPSAVLLNSIGEDGKLLLSLLDDPDLKRSLPNLLWALNPILLKDNAEKVACMDNNLISCNSWNGQGTLDASNLSRDLIKLPHVFSALGYEVGVVAEQILKNSKKDFISSRGQMQWSSDKSQLLAPQYLLNYSKTASNVIHLENKNSMPNSFHKTEQSIPRNGWKNPFLCY